MDPMLTFMHLADSAYPTGAFAHSWGLEAAIAGHLVTNGEELRTWGSETLHYSLLPLDTRACARAWQETAAGNMKGVLALERELVLYRPGRSIREAQAQVGRSLLEITTAIYPLAMAGKLLAFYHTSELRDFIQHPVAWGVCCHESGIDQETTLKGFLHGSIRQMAQVAVRLIPLGQREANLFIADLNKEISALDWSEWQSGEFMSICPGLDIAGMAHENLEARYFRS